MNKTQIIDWICKFSWRLESNNVSCYMIKAIWKFEGEKICNFSNNKQINYIKLGDIKLHVAELAPIEDTLEPLL